MRTRSCPMAALIASAILSTSCGPSKTPTDGAPEPLVQPRDWDRAIRTTDAVDLDDAPGVVEVELEARVVSLEVREGVLTEVWSYNGTLPGPTIRARAGDRVVVRFHNALPEATTIHWHGLRVEAAMDGVGPLVPPGGDFVYELDVPDAGTFWYHPHVDSSAQLGAGLSGAIVVESAEEPFFGDELVLVIGDMSIQDDGSLRPGDDTGWFGDFFGREGNVALVNGRPMPTLLARAGVPQRWRIVNASRSRYQKLALPGEGFTQIAVDGGLIDRPIENAELLLPPGARADVVFVASTPAASFVVAHLGFDRVHSNTPQRPVDLFRVEVDGAPALAAPALPSVLRDIEVLDVTGARPQKVTFMNMLGDDGNTATAINGQIGADADPFTAATDSVELWTLENTTSMDHPFHLHGFFFQVLDVDGVVPERRAWRDTINVAPRQVVRIAPVFDDRAGTWMFHCHILDHAELGMMRTLIVGTASAGASSGHGH